MKYKVIADISHLNDRVCIYMKFDPQDAMPLQFACKTQINGVVSSVKDKSFQGALAWLGFNELSNALYQDDKFSKRYRTNIHKIFENQLMINVINDIPYFFYKLKDHWEVTEDLSELTPYFNDNLSAEIETILGTSFMKNYNALVKEKTTCQSISIEYEQQKQLLIEAAKKSKEEKSLSVAS